MCVRVVVDLLSWNVLSKSSTRFGLAQSSCNYIDCGDLPRIRY